MGLLRADLQALANLPATAAGRRLVFGTLLGLGLLALMWWSAAMAVHREPQALALLHASTHGRSLHGLLGTGLLPCPIAATWLGLSLAQRQLFEAPELLLWRTAPTAGLRAPLQVLLRAAFLTLLWAAALALPFLAAQLLAAPAGPLAWLLLPVAVVGCTVPLLAALLAVHIVLVRFFAGRVLRLVLAVLAALASVGFSTWLLLGLFAPGPATPVDVGASADRAQRLPWTIDTAATLLAGAAEGRLDGAALGTLLGWLGLALLLFAGAACLHPRAVERHLEAQAPLLRARRGPWPGGITAVIWRKEFAQVLQQPGALIGFLVFAVLVFALARERVLVDGLLRDRRLPRDLAHLAAMSVQWFLAVLLVLYAHMGRLVLWDGAQWSLYRSAPAAPLSILRGKLVAVAAFLLWPLLLVALAGAQAFGAGAAAVLAFAGVAAGGTLAALGVLAVVGTSPRLMRPDDGAMAQGGRSFLAALLLVVLFQLALAPAMFAWLRLLQHLRRHRLAADEVLALLPWVVGAALAWGVVVAALGIALGARNFRRLSAAT
ncbi:MAG: hypothetical protein KF830_14645 [Planctomycetes bacterium]|nr:hypothetical protein [Planctomycetota bacterium]